ncbi:TIGR03088 family PEP-CTERM/XrtA system glycosyltransferase [Pseudomonadota bacterium]
MAHVIHRLDFGGLENGLVNLINRIPQSQYRHAIICMTDYSEFSKRITNPAVTLHALHKVDGKGLDVYLRLWRLLRQLKPDIVHTRNLSALEAGVVAWFAGVPGRVHGEHGRDSYDIDGTNKKYLLLRRLCQPFIQCYIPLSKDLEGWLKTRVKIPENKMRQIYNGVDSGRFCAHEQGQRRSLPDRAQADGKELIIGTVGRVQEVKDQLTLVKAVADLVACNKEYRKKLKLVIVGDGPMMGELESLVQEKNVADITWLSGARNDIPELLQAMDLFVLPSKAEGVSNTILEAMATSLPVVATAVGGNSELVVDGKTGSLVPPQDSKAMAAAIRAYIQEPEKLQCRGQAGRLRVEQQFSIEAMVNAYMAVYDEVSLQPPAYKKNEKSKCAV